MHAWKVFRFVVSGTTAALVNIGALFFLVHGFGIYYLFGSAIAFLISIIVSFTLQKFWTFRDHSIEGMHMQFGKYALVSGTNLCLNTLIVYLLVERFGIWYLAAQFIAGLAVAVSGYFGYQKFVFRPAT